MPTLRDMLTAEVAAGLDRYLTGLQEPETAPQAINRIVADWLSSLRYLEYAEIPEGEMDQDA